MISATLFQRNTSMQCLSDDVGHPCSICGQETKSELNLLLGYLTACEDAMVLMHWFFTDMPQKLKWLQDSDELLVAGLMEWAFREHTHHPCIASNH